MCWFVATDHVLLRSNRACVAPKQPMFGGYVATNNWSPDAEKSKIAPEQRKIDLNNEFCTVFHVDIENHHWNRRIHASRSRKCRFFKKNWIFEKFVEKSIWLMESIEFFTLSSIFASVWLGIGLKWSKNRLFRLISRQKTYGPHEAMLSKQIEKKNCG